MKESKQHLQDLWLLGALRTRTGSRFAPGFPASVASVLSVVPVFFAALLTAATVHAATLHRGVGPEPDSLDIHTAQSLSALNVLRDLHEGLLTFDAGAELVPGVAASWSVSEDGRVWTFELHEAARWSDGRPIVAGDFVAGWRRALDPATASPTAALLDPVENAHAVRTGEAAVDTLGIDAPAPDRLEIRLERPLPWFGELLTHPVTYPWPGDSEGRYSGAFVLVEQLPGARLELKPNPHYREADTVALDGVTWHVIEQPDVELSRYRAGQLHITETIPPGRVDWLREQFGDELRIAPYLGSFFLAFNLRREPFADAPELRRALSLAIDRDILVERVLGSGEIPAWGLIPPGMPGWPEGREPPLPPGERLAEARRLYREAGYDEARPLRVELRFNTSLTHRRMAVAIAAMWKLHLGVQTGLVNEEWKVFIANRRQGRITEVFRGGWIADWRDAGNFLQLFESDGPGNYTFFDDPEFDRLMRRAARERGDERLSTLREAESLLLDEQVIVPLYYYVSRHLVDPAVRGFEDNPMDIHLSRWMALP
ncbi:MAG: peptide ABC transporter substrate-binding protein [Gammaproteobacteria bacterium]|jgi:oligopeptide transport system substrate-binding protein|nr:peptide ABC transporter substrate-binding protein [Gammaproteobacteria bacterium]